jgi:hypothetical protein
MAEPMLISSPRPEDRHNEVTYSMTSLLDIVPTLLDWFNIPYPHQNEVKPVLTGKSLLPLLVKGNLLICLSMNKEQGTLNIGKFISEQNYVSASFKDLCQTGLV